MIQCRYTLSPLYNGTSFFRDEVEQWSPFITSITCQSTSYLTHAFLMSFPLWCTLWFTIYESATRISVSISRIRYKHTSKRQPSSTSYSYRQFQPLHLGLDLRSEPWERYQLRNDLACLSQALNTILQVCSSEDMFVFIATRWSPLTTTTAWRQRLQLVLPTNWRVNQ